MSYPLLSTLMAAADIPVAVQHPVLGDTGTRSMVLRHQQHRSNIARIMKDVQRRGESIPTDLEEALLSMLADEEFRAPGSNPSTPAPSPLRTSSGKFSASGSTGSLTPITQKVEQEQALPNRTPEDHIQFSLHAVSRAGTVNADGSLILPKYSVKSLLEEAYAARRNGDRGGEIRVLLRYLDLGQSGAVPFDSSASFRVFRQLGDAYAAVGDAVSAEHFYFDWYLAADKLGEDNEAIKALMQLGKLKQDLGELDKAEDWYGKAQARSGTFRSR
jgi:hypothetical protein